VTELAIYISVVIWRVAIDLHGFMTSKLTF